MVNHGFSSKEPYGFSRYHGFHTDDIKEIHRPNFVVLRKIMMIIDVINDCFVLKLVSFHPALHCCFNTFVVRCAVGNLFIIGQHFVFGCEKETTADFS